MTRDFAPAGDPLYGLDPLLPETGPIAVDIPGPVPSQENNDTETLRLCTTCGLVEDDCVCKREGA